MADKGGKSVKMNCIVEGVMPQYANSNAAGMDLCIKTEEDLIIESGGHAFIHTGFYAEIPEGHFGLVAIRSGLGAKGLMLSNGIGVIDSDYRGEIRIPLFNHSDKAMKLEDGERVAQMIILPYVRAELEEKESLEGTERGNLGFGSSGRF